jgi:hypothetical protein
MRSTLKNLKFEGRSVGLQRRACGVGCLSISLYDVEIFGGETLTQTRAFLTASRFLITFSKHPNVLLIPSEYRHAFSTQI